MASQQSPEARELTLVGNVEFRIASASTDRKLEELLDKFLVPLLLKLASESLAVRNKVSHAAKYAASVPLIAVLLQVISVCQHITKRIVPPQYAFTLCHQPY